MKTIGEIYKAAELAGQAAVVSELERDYRRGYLHGLIAYADALARNYSAPDRGAWLAEVQRWKDAAFKEPSPSLVQPPEPKRTTSKTR